MPDYAVKEKDGELIALLDVLVAKLELEDAEDSILGKLFAKLLIKAKNICEAELHLKGIFVTFEFIHFFEEFKKKIVEKMPVKHERKKEEEKFYNLLARYSNN